MATTPLCKTKLVGQVNELKNVTKMILTLTAGTFQTVNILIWGGGWREKVSRCHGASVRGMYMTRATWQGPTNFVILYISYRFICSHNAKAGLNVSSWGSMNHDKTCVQVTSQVSPLECNFIDINKLQNWSIIIATNFDNARSHIPSKVNSFVQIFRL